MRSPTIASLRRSLMRPTSERAASLGCSSPRPLPSLSRSLRPIPLGLRWMASGGRACRLDRRWAPACGCHIVGASRSCWAAAKPSALCSHPQLLQAGVGPWQSDAGSCLRGRQVAASRAQAGRRPGQAGPGSDRSAAAGVECGLLPSSRLGPGLLQLVPCCAMLCCAGPACHAMPCCSARCFPACSCGFHNRLLGRVHCTPAGLPHRRGRGRGGSAQPDAEQMGHRGEREVRALPHNITCHV